MVLQRLASILGLVSGGFEDGPPEAQYIILGVYYVTIIKGVVTCVAPVSFQYVAVLFLSIMLVQTLPIYNNNNYYYTIHVHVLTTTFLLRSLHQTSN